MVDSVRVGQSSVACVGLACPNHCCGAFEGASASFRPLEDRLFSEIILLPEDEAALRDGGFESYAVRGADGIARIKTAPDGTCSALRNGKCSVYSCRPAICKAYPLDLDMFVGACVSKDCPVSSGIDITACPEELAHLISVYEFWIARYKRQLGDGEGLRARR